MTDGVIGSCHNNKIKQKQIKESRKLMKVLPPSSDIPLFVFIFISHDGVIPSRHLSSYFPWHHFPFIYYFIVRLRYI